jgi:hypothetical protein
MKSNKFSISYLYFCLLLVKFIKYPFHANGYVDTCQNGVNLSLKFHGRDEDAKDSRCDR